MKKIVTNEYNLKDEEITEVVKKVKILLVNLEEEVIYLGYRHNDYMFPGAFIDNSKELEESVKDEVLKQLDVDFEISHISPILCVSEYYKNWPRLGCNRRTETYYYVVKIKDEIKNLKINYRGIDYVLKKIKFDKVISELEENATIFGDKMGATSKIIELYEWYKNNEE